MFNDMLALFSGWYESYVSSIKTILDNVDSETGIVTTPEIWSAYVPWEALIAAVVLVVFVIVFFRFLRSVLCKMF